MKAIVQFLIIISLVLLAGCQHKNKTSQTKTTQSEQKQKTNKQQLTFNKGMPKKIRGNYYRYEVEPSLTESDNSYALKLAEDKISLDEISADINRQDTDDIWYYKLADNLYMLQEDELLFQKVKLLPNNDLELFESYSKYSMALKTQEKKIYHRGQLPKGQDLSPKDLEGKYFVCDTDFTKYLQFNAQNHLNSYKGMVQTDGSTKFEFYSADYIKQGKYFVKLMDPSKTGEYLTFTKISDHQVKDDVTGETYSLFENAYKSPQAVALDKLGIKPDPGQFSTPDTKKKPSEPKTFDFADDKDDDYYDTYDDFDLNNGD